MSTRRPLTPRALLLALPSLAGLLTVPVAVRALQAQGDTLEQAHDALFALADAGVIELRPAAAADLAGGDADLCPPGPAGHVFATLLVIGGAS